MKQPSVRPAVAGPTRRQWLVAGGALALPAVVHAAGPRSPPLGSAIDWPALPMVDGSVLPPHAWRDTAAIIVFFSTDCAYCMRHNAHLDKLNRTLGKRPVRILGAALDTDPALVRAYVAAHRTSFPVAMGAGAYRARFTQRRIIPMTVIVDRHGRLVQAFPGEMAEADVLELADRVLALG